MTKYYSIAEMAQELSLPESTVRYYRDRFKSYVPAVKKGQRKVYDEQALEALRIIAEGLRKGENAATVEGQLSLSFSQTIDTKDIAAAAQQQSVFSREDWQKELESRQQLVDTMQELNKSILSLTEKIEGERPLTFFQWLRSKGRGHSKGQE